eukprot:6460198-Amphidinium_carterae.1
MSIHYKVKLESEMDFSDEGQIKETIESSADSDWPGCNTTRKSTSGSITMCWGVPLLHISRTQATVALQKLSCMHQKRHNGRHTTKGIDNQIDSHSSQSNRSLRCPHQAPTSNYNTLTP